MKKKNLLILNKPAKITSNKITQYIKSILKINKLGYHGTLDPSATGLLIIFINNTKIIKTLDNKKKTYISINILGIKSMTEDLDGKIKFYEKNITYKIIKQSNKNLKIIEKIPTQSPPIFSSIKHNNKSMYKYARFDLNIKIKHRQIKIQKITKIFNNNKILIIKIICSKGVYIRSIISDLSNLLKTPLCIIKIIRIKIDNFKILNSLNLSEIKKLI